MGFGGTGTGVGFREGFGVADGLGVGGVAAAVELGAGGVTATGDASVHGETAGDDEGPLVSHAASRLQRTAARSARRHLTQESSGATRCGIASAWVSDAPLRRPT
jgi:hypothetical protein